MDGSLTNASLADESTASCCIRLRLHIALQSSVPQLVDEMIRLLNAKPEVSYCPVDLPVSP